MKLKKSPSVLVVVLCETRAWEITAAEFFRNVIKPLDADLALCVGNSEREVDNPFYDEAEYVWKYPEPEDWGDAFEEVAGNRDWEVLLSVHELFFGGIQHETNQNSGSGAIIMFFRYFLAMNFNEKNLIEKYDWLIVTRSDFRWPSVHPLLEYLDEDFLYALDGEQWGGVSDRYIAIPRKLIPSYFQIVEPLFSDPVNLAKKLKDLIDSELPDDKYMNPEKFLAFRMKELKLWRRLRWLPYIPFAVRLEGGHTRWSQGVLDESLGYFVMYSGEYSRSMVVSEFIRDQSDWKKYFARFIKSCRVFTSTAR
jgi:hypothetical protein